MKRVYTKLAHYLRRDEINTKFFGIFPVFFTNFQFVFAAKLFSLSKFSLNYRNEYSRISASFMRLKPLFLLLNPF
jgi:hypothetical protein